MLAAGWIPSLVFSTLSKAVIGGGAENIGHTSHHATIRNEGHWRLGISAELEGKQGVGIRGLGGAPGHCQNRMEYRGLEWNINMLQSNEKNEVKTRVWKLA